VTGLSKCFGAGLRIAYIQAPAARLAERLSGALRATTVMASPFTTMLATAWLGDGTADDMLKSIRAECMARQAIASHVLAGRHYEADPEGFHLWLAVPPESGWSPSEFALNLRGKGVAVVSSSAFSTDGNPPDAIRICLGGPCERDDIEESLQIVVDTIDHAHHLHAPML
jgi:DNA-binding transcriptional MocR family regulator